MKCKHIEICTYKFFLYLFSFYYDLVISIDFVEVKILLKVWRIWRFLSSILSGKVIPEKRFLKDGDLFCRSTKQQQQTQQRKNYLFSSQVTLSKHFFALLFRVKVWCISFKNKSNQRKTFHIYLCIRRVFQTF